MKYVFGLLIAFSVSAWSMSGSESRVINGTKYSISTVQPAPHFTRAAYFREGANTAEYAYQELGYSKDFQKYPKEPSKDPLTDCKPTLGCLTVDMDACQKIDKMAGKNPDLTSAQATKCIDFINRVSFSLQSKKLVQLNNEETEKIDSFAKADGLLNKYWPDDSKVFPANKKFQDKAVASLSRLQWVFSACQDLKRYMSDQAPNGISKKNSLDFPSDKNFPGKASDNTAR
jgi:hypothetical protein